MNKVPTIFILMASAGHGKDYVKLLIEENINKKSKDIKFAETAKEIIATSLKSKFISSDMSIDEKINKLNDLKDNHMDTKVLGEENMRKMLQIVLGDVIREVNPNIHALFALKSIEEQLINDSDYLMICTDNRYVNEQELIYPINLLETKKEKVDYIRWAIDYNKTIMKTEDILNLFDKLTKPYIDDSSDQSMINKIKMKFIKENDNLNNTTKSELNYYEFTKSINFKKIKNMSKKESFENGLIHIFRPLLPANEKYKNLNEESLIIAITEFNKSPKEDIKKIKNNYEIFDINFNYENIQKYGYLRADPSHYSETALNDRKPEAFFNFPETYEENIKSEMKSFFLKEDKKIKNKVKNKMQ
jgi:hypothetical protein